MKNCIYINLSIALIFTSITFAQDSIVEEVIVTATKTEKTLQEVPVAVSVITSDELEKATIIDTLDLKSIIPSLDTRQYQSSTNATFFIRGFGNGSNNPGIEPSVALFVDGVYRSKTQSQISDLPMLERVEVLRGPQSTLFGKNASAGVINIVTKKPSFDKSGMMSFGVGKYNSKIGKIYTTGPINETTAYSFNANFNKRDGSSDNPVTGNSVNNRDRLGLRAELLFIPNDDLSIRVTADYDEYDEICCAVGSANYGTANVVTAAFGGQIIPNNPYTEKAFFDFDPISDGDNSGISIYIERDLDNIRIESITSSRKSYNFELQDVDFESVDQIDANKLVKDLDAVTQEIRIFSEDNENINWLLGAYYYQEDMKYDNSIYFGSLWRAYIDALAPGSFGWSSRSFWYSKLIIICRGSGC